MQTADESKTVSLTLALLPSDTCRSCGRILANEESRKIGIGPVCLSKRKERLATVQIGYGKNARLPMRADRKDVVMLYTDDGDWATNVPQTYVEHSPSGFAWGYGGSGPADLALNILALFVTSESVWYRDGEKITGTVRTWSKQDVPAVAYRMHQSFKWAFIGDVPREGGVIRGEDIRTWLREQAVEGIL